MTPDDPQTADAPALSEQPKGCIGCKTTVVVGYTIGKKPGPFCVECWRALKDSVAALSVSQAPEQQNLDWQIELTALALARADPDADVRPILRGFAELVRSGVSQAPPQAWQGKEGVK